MAARITALLLLVSLVAAVLVGTYSTVLAQRSYGYGHGSQSCGTWVTERTKDSLASVTNTTWVLGYVSGAEYAGEWWTTGHRLKETDADAVEVCVNNYCQEHPFELLAAAAEALVEELHEASTRAMPTRHAIHDNPHIAAHSPASRPREFTQPSVEVWTPP